MSRILNETLTLYRSAFRKTGASLVRGWMTIVAVVGFGFLLLFATQIASPLGMIGGFLLGAVNALLVGREFVALAIYGDHGAALAASVDHLLRGSDDFRQANLARHFIELTAQHVIGQ